MTFRVFVASKIIPDLYLTTLRGVSSVRKTGGRRRRAITPDCCSSPSALSGASGLPAEPEKKS